MCCDNGNKNTLLDEYEMLITKEAHCLACGKGRQAFEEKHFTEQQQLLMTEDMKKEFLSLKDYRRRKSEDS